jgi:uncharacterized delta-60 repeat protein
MRTLCLLLLCSIVLIKAAGQAGSLDPSFGNNGIQTTTFFSNANTLNEEGRAVLTSANGDLFVVLNIGRIARYLPDGRLDSSYGNAGYSNAVDLNVTSATLQGDKIIVAGGSILARYTANGSLDSSFGENGTVTTGFSVTSIALQGSKIIATGPTGNYPNTDFALARYTADGALDYTFGADGQVTTDLGGDDHSNAIALQGDKIIVAGYTKNENYLSGDFALARYTADGKLDSTFGVNGKVTTDFNNSEDQVTSIALQGDKIIVGGSTTDGGSIYFVLARYTANGSLDSSFGVNGKVTTNFFYLSVTIVLQGDKIVAAGTSNDFDFALVRYTANGTLDASFGVNGKVTTDFNNTYDQANGIALQEDKIIVAGYTSLNHNNDFALVRYTANGALDASFGKLGLLTGYFPTNQLSFTSTAIQGNKVIAAGSAFTTNGSNNIALARYTVNGTLDSTFGENGLVITDFTGQANAIALQGDKIIVAGGSILARYTANGSLDSSFGENGTVATAFGVNAIALQGDKIIAAGNIYFFYFALARYTTDGALDSSFGVNGMVITDFPNYDESIAYANSVVLQGDKIIAAGYDYLANSDVHVFALARYSANGTLDSTFGVNGLVTTNFKGYYHTIDIANSIALQGDKIIAAGFTYSGDNDNFALARYTTDGTLDSSFGVNGQVTEPLGHATSIVLQGDKIIAGGSNGDFALVRYTGDGTLDSSFGVNGEVITHLDGSSSIQGIALQQNRLYAVGSLGQSGESYGVIAAYQLEATGPAICISDVTVCESQKQAVLTVHLSAPSTQAVQVDYHTHYITAYPTKDYLSTKYTLQFAPGTTTAKINISIVDDSICEPTEQFEVILRNAQHATIKDSIGIVTITDDDKALVTAQASTAQQNNAQVSRQQNSSLRILSSPNPSANAFTIQLQGNNVKQPVNIRVYDIKGRLLEERMNISIGQSLSLGDHYKAGTYIIEALQGNRSVQTKVIKIDK